MDNTCGSCGACGYFINADIHGVGWCDRWRVGTYDSHGGCDYILDEDEAGHADEDQLGTLLNGPLKDQPDFTFSCIAG